MIRVTSSISLQDDEISLSFIRSPGAGGQKVNKTETAVQLRFDARSSPALTEAVFARLKTLAGRRMTADGVIVLTANRFRTQERNRQDAIERLLSLIRQAAVPPKPRRPTRPTLGSKKRRLEGKHIKAGIKKMRGRVTRED